MLPVLDAEEYRTIKKANLPLSVPFKKRGKYPYLEVGLGPRHSDYLGWTSQRINPRFGFGIQSQIYSTRKPERQSVHDKRHVPTNKSLSDDNFNEGYGQGIANVDINDFASPMPPAYINQPPPPTPAYSFGRSSPFEGTRYRNRNKKNANQRKESRNKNCTDENPGVSYTTQILLERSLSRQMLEIQENDITEEQQRLALGRSTPRIQEAVGNPSHPLPTKSGYYFVNKLPDIYEPVQLYNTTQSLDQQYVPSGNDVEVRSAEDENPDITFKGTGKRHVSLPTL